MHQTGPAALDRSPRTGRLLLLATPWVLAAGLAILGLLGNRGGEAAAGPTSDWQPEVEGGPSVAPSPGASQPVVDVAPEVGAPREVTLPASLLLEVLGAARTALGTAGLEDGGVGPHDTRWPVETHVIAVEWVAADRAVVTVHGLVLERTTRSWTGPHLAAVAVPVRLGVTPRIAGAAWPLPQPTVPAASAAVPMRTPIDDTDTALVVTEAIAAGGWTVDDVTRIDDLGDGIVAATFVGRLDSATATTHTVWVHHSDQGSVLLPKTTTPLGVPTGEETP